MKKYHIYSSGKELTCMNHLSSTIDIDLVPVLDRYFIRKYLSDQEGKKLSLKLN